MSAEAIALSVRCTVLLAINNNQCISLSDMIETFILHRFPEQAQRDRPLAK